MLLRRARQKLAASSSHGGAGNLETFNMQKRDRFSRLNDSLRRTSMVLMLVRCEMTWGRFKRRGGKKPWKVTPYFSSKSAKQKCLGVVMGFGGKFLNEKVFDDVWDRPQCGKYPQNHQATIHPFQMLHSPDAWDNFLNQHHLTSTYPAKKDPCNELNDAKLLRKKTCKTYQRFTIHLPFMLTFTLHHPFTVHLPLPFTLHATANQHRWLSDPVSLQGIPQHCQRPLLQLGISEWIFSKNMIRHIRL